MGKMSRTKGHAWEREVARDLTEATGVLHRRVLTETRDGNIGDVRGLGVVYQCKCVARADVFQAVREAEAACGGTEYAVAAVKRSARGRSPEMIAAMPWSDWLEILSQLTTTGVWK
jgi:hypothetical protein